MEVGLYPNDLNAALTLPNNYSKVYITYNNIICAELENQTFNTSKRESCFIFSFHYHYI